MADEIRRLNPMSDALDLLIDEDGTPVSGSESSLQVQQEGWTFESCNGISSGEHTAGQTNSMILGHSQGVSRQTAGLGTLNHFYGDMKDDSTTGEIDWDMMRALTNKAVEIAYDDAKDYMRESRNTFLVIKNGCYSRVKVYTNNTPLITPIWNGHIKGIELIKVDRKLYGRLIFEVYAVNSFRCVCLTQYGQFHPISFLKALNHTEELLKEGLNLCEKNGINRTMLSFVNGFIVQFLREADDGIEEAHLGFCHVNDTLKYVDELPKIQGYTGKLRAEIKRIKFEVGNDINQLVRSMMSAYRRIGEEGVGGSIFLVSYCATFFSLFGLKRSEIVLVLLGDVYISRRIVAQFMKNYMRDDEDDYIAASGGVPQRKEYLRILWDDVVSVVADSDDNNSKTNISEFFDAAKNGNYRDIRLHSFFALCTDDAGRATFENQIVLKVNDLQERFFTDCSPQIFRNFVIGSVEDCASYFMERIPTLFKSLTNYGKQDSVFLNAVRAASTLIKEVLVRNSVKAEIVSDFQDFCKEGIDMMKQQLKDKEKINPITFFQRTVIDGIASGRYKVWNRFKPMQGNIKTSIFYDDDYYYIPKDTFLQICKDGSILESSRSRLAGLLAEAGFLIREGFGKREFGRDIWYKNGENKTQRVNGYFICSHFWSKENGSVSLVDLYEECKGQEAAVKEQ